MLFFTVRNREIYFFLFMNINYGVLAPCIENFILSPQSAVLALIYIKFCVCVCVLVVYCCTENYPNTEQLKATNIDYPMVSVG